MTDNKNQELTYGIWIAIFCGTSFTGVFLWLNGLFGPLISMMCGFVLTIGWLIAGAICIPLTQKAINELNPILNKENMLSAWALVLWPIICGGLIIYGCAKVIMHIIR